MVIDSICQTWKEGDQYMAHAMPIGVMSSGPTPAAARQALDEAVEVFLETLRDQVTLQSVLEECGYRQENGRWSCPESMTERRAVAI